MTYSGKCSTHSQDSRVCMNNYHSNQTCLHFVPPWPAGFIQLNTTDHTNNCVTHPSLPNTKSSRDPTPHRYILETRALTLLNVYTLSRYFSCSFVSCFYNTAEHLRSFTNIWHHRPQIWSVTSNIKMIYERNKFKSWKKNWIFFFQMENWLNFVCQKYNYIRKMFCIL